MGQYFLNIITDGNGFLSVAERLDSSSMGIMIFRDRMERTDI